MSSSARKGRGRSAAAPESDNDDDSVASHSSRASRSSARLKRKRESQAAAVEPIPEKEDLEFGESSPAAAAKRSAKRQRVKSAKKKTPAAKRRKQDGGDESSEAEDGEDEQKQSVPMEIETKNDNGDHRVEENGDEEQDAKLSAVPENGHAAPVSAAAAPAADASVPSMNHVKPAAAAAASMEPVQSKRRASEPRATSQEQPSKDRLSSSLQKQRRESEPHQRHSIRKEPPLPPQQQPQPQLEAPLPAEEPTGNGDAAVEAQPQIQRITEYVVELSGYAWDYVYESTTMAVVRASDVMDQVVGRRDADEQEEIVEEAVGEVILEDELKPSPWERTRNWWILLLFLQLILFPYWINPILDLTAASSDVLLKLYSRGRKGNRSLTSSTTGGTEDAEARIREQLLMLEQRQTELETLLGIREVAQSKADEMIVTLQESLTVKQKSLNQANINANAAIKELEELVKLEADAMVRSQYFLTVSSLLEKAENSDITPLIDTSRVELWTEDQDDETCANIFNEEPTSPLLKREDFDEAFKSAFTGASLAAAAVQKDPEMIAMVQDWIRGTLRNETDVVVPGEKDRAPSSSGGGAEMARLRRLLAFRLEQEMADQTGLWDYASIPNGAQVIRSKTSPSLVDTLPIVNRISSALGLRFYGHGPEAALTPTHPPFALGQCWSFPDQSEGTTEPVFGVLTIRLTRPIYVQSVLIEHPPKDVAGQGINSAIRTFHIQGYEAEDASGEAWELGSFKYEIGSDSRQEFEVETEVDDEDIPVLRAISIEIESNWGGEYACLYRFRVHGEEDDEDEELNDDE